MNGVELFEKIKSVSSFSELLQSINYPTKTETQSKRGNVFEKTCDLIIKCGFCSFLSNDVYDHYEGDIATGELKKVDNLELHIKNQKVFSKGKGGKSDITLKNKHTAKWIFISCKFGDVTSVTDFDIDKICLAVKDKSHIYKEYEIYLFVNDTERTTSILNSAHEGNAVYKNNVSHIFDTKAFEQMFQNLKQTIQDMNLDEVNTKFCNAKVPLELRFHQDLITFKQMNLIAEGEKDLLLGAKARSGKTYCVGGLFIKYHKKYNLLNALIITPAPTETLTQFTDDVFHKFRDFMGISIIEIKKGSDFGNMELQEYNIIIVSKQLLDDYVFENKIQSIQDICLDFIVFDENHFHGTTEMSKNILQSYSCAKTVKLYLTATYAKPLREWHIPPKCQLYWDIEDEQLCKKRNVEGLVERHGEEVSLFVKEESKEAMLKIYDNMPDLHILTNMMDMQRHAQIKELIKDTSYGFSFSALFCGKYPNEVDLFFRGLTGSHKETDFPKGDLSIFERIKNLSIMKNNRTKLNNGDFTTQLWFLPFGVNMTIHKVSEHVEERMLKNKILAKYEIKIVNSSKDYKLKDIKSKIAGWELEAKTNEKDGLILLAGNQLTLGITLPFVDTVFLFNDVVSSDKIVQMMYRCMTESMNTSDSHKINAGRKTIGIVVDLNMSRVLNTLLDYNVQKKDLSVPQKFTYLIEKNLINIDSDLFQGKENKTKLVEQLMHYWKANPMNHLKCLLKRIEDNVIDLDTNDQKAVNQYFTSSVGDEKINVKVKFDEDSGETLATGKQQTKQPVNGQEEPGKEEEEQEEQEKCLNISLTKDVLPFIIPLSCILTVNTQDRDMSDMLKLIKANPALLEVFQDQSYIWWNKPDVIDMIEKIVEKYVKKDSLVYNIAIQFKMSLQSLIDNPKDLLELIDSCLKPKQKEKQENGEVFTPMLRVFELLDELDKYYFKTYGKSIFTEKNFRWFDPASGMGNFPVAVYLKLMEGLKQEIPDQEERKKHILENMLFMSELNKKNVFICQQIFNINNQYKLNLHEGDTLKLDVMQKWNIHKFNVVLGNPAYNKGGIRSHTGKQLGDKNETIWPNFIELSFKWLEPDGFLAFITPLSWLKHSHSLHAEMLDRHIIWLKLWDDSQSKNMINADIPISLYVLQNTMNTMKKTTEIVSEIKRKKQTTYSTEYLNKDYSVPLAFHSIFEKLLQFINQHNCKLEYKTKTVKSTGTKTKIPATYALEDMWAIDTYTLEEGILIKKATELHPDANKRKLIIANKRGFKGAFIDEGKLSLTGNHKFYILGENVELIQKMLGFGISTVVSDYLKYGQSFLDTEAFKYLPDIRKLGIQDMTEDEFYKLIGLTRQEVNQIKNPNSTGDNEDEEIKQQPPVKKSSRKGRPTKPIIEFEIIEEVL